ncbi:chromosome segregation protein Spc25-domain-containing protein [Lipomyces oligophaga]|uniref:chromosome segregation protein Spc25-domain-containing protein n=1 Tax=Lipomyces oligophaga TaxID=45792 RepID=UPI0034CEE2E7
MSSIASLRSTMEALELSKPLSSQSPDENSQIGSVSIPQFSFDFTKLCQKMDNFQARFDEYIASERKRVLEERNRFDKQIQDGKEQEQKMITQIDYYRKKEDDICQEITREQQEIKDTEKSIESFDSQKRELTLQLEAIMKQISEVQMQNERRRNERSQERARILQQTSLNVPELEFWEKYLGLRIEAVHDDHLKFVFTLVDDSNWDKEYYAVVDLSCHDYQVPESQPELATEVLEPILARLNSSREFGRFLKEIRAGLKASGLTSKTAV